MRLHTLSLLIPILLLSFCKPESRDTQETSQPTTITIDSAEQAQEAAEPKLLEAEDIEIRKDYSFPDYILEDQYTYKEENRSIKWVQIKTYVARVENKMLRKENWGVFENYRNGNGEAKTVKHYIRNDYKLLCDTFGVERYQSAPLYLLTDSVQPYRYARDGWLGRLTQETESFYQVKPAETEEEYLVPKRYFRLLGDSVRFEYLVFVDRGDQNICTLKRTAKGEWTALSTNPATTGIKRPPYAHPTPLGIYLLQQKKEKMYYFKDGTKEIGGYAPYASRFTDGAYIHGIPVNKPRTKMIEYSRSLGTTPRSHMCVRNATSHAKFIFEEFPTDASLIIVIE